MNNGTFSLTQCINNIISNWKDDYNINLLVMPAELNQEALSNIITCNTIYPLQTISQAHSAMTEVDFFWQDADIILLVNQFSLILNLFWYLRN